MSQVAVMAEPVAVVYISWGIWVARCPADGCPGAEHFGADRNTGIVGGLTMDRFTCVHCGLTCRAVWPDPEVAADVVRLLAMRPVPATRSWLVGEEPENLLAENVHHGLLSDEDLIPPGLIGSTSIPLMANGRMAPHVRELVTARARAVMAAERARGELRWGADRMLEIGV